MVTKQNFFKRKFAYINTFDHQLLTVVLAMRDLTSGSFEHLEIPSPPDADKIVRYTQRLLRRLALKKYKTILK